MQFERDWVRRQNVSSPDVVILGLGAGHHVKAWLDLHPQARVVVIDTKSYQHDFFRMAYPEIQDRVEIHAIGCLDELREHAVMNKMIRDLPSVLLFEPAVGAHREIFDEYFRLLTGRSREGLEFFLRHLGFEIRQPIEVCDAGRLLTIKDLGLVIDTQHAGHPRAAVVRVLRELLV
ncbi:MAG: hypothetical protein KF802_12005 [Bdellovibrionaceae bacterium]|nr:hypothetical protein [Pseudobdellovibrionaceae bacterium]